MSGLGLTFLRRGGQAHPTAGASMDDDLIAKYTFVGRSNDDADKTIVADESGRGLPMQVNFSNWGSGDDYTKTGYYDDCLCSFPGSSNYAHIPLSEAIGSDFTIIIEREFYNLQGLAQYSTLLGSDSSLSTSSSAFFIEYKNSNTEIYSSVQGSRTYTGRSNSPIVWMTPNTYCGIINESYAPSNNAIATNLYIGRVRLNIYNSQRFKIKSIHIFRKAYPAEMVANYIKRNIDSNYVLPIE